MIASRSEWRAFPAIFALGALLACGGEEAPREGRDEAPQRIVSLAPSLTELLFRLGAGDRVVGVTRFCDRPPQVRRIAAVGDAKQVSLERLAALRPDLILINAAAVASALAPLGGRFPVVLAPTETIGEMLDSIEVVGAAIGAETRARALRDELEQHVAGMRATAGGSERGKVLVVLQRDPFYVAGPGSYLDELLEILGWQNATADLASHWPCISAEALIGLAPDVILDTGFGGAEGADADAEVRAYWERFPTVPAVRDGHVGALRSDVVLRPGPALREALEALRGVLARVSRR